MLLPDDNPPATTTPLLPSFSVPVSFSVPLRRSRRRRRRAKSESDTHSLGRALGGGDVGEVGGVASLLGGDGVGGGCPQAGESVAEHVGVGVVSAIDGVEAAGPLGMTFARWLL